MYVMEFYVMEHTLNLQLPFDVRINVTSSCNGSDTMESIAKLRPTVIEVNKTDPV